MPWTRKVPSCLIPEVVGQVPQEFSCIICFLKEKGGRMVASVYDAKYQPSPIPKGGLEIS